MRFLRTLPLLEVGFLVACAVSAGVSLATGGPVIASLVILVLGAVVVIQGHHLDAARATAVRALAREKSHVCPGHVRVVGGPQHQVGGQR